MQQYRTYLQEKGYAQSSIETYIKQAQSFTKWCHRNHTTPIDLDYKEGLKYIKYLQQKAVSKKTINHRLGSVKNYLNYLVQENYKSDNPLANTTVKGIKRQIHYNLLDPEELEDLYYSFESSNAIDDYVLCCAKRDKIIVGLLVYQGLDTQDLKQLKTEHLQLNKGKLYIPRRPKSNGRTLELKPWQLMELLEYLNQTREQLLERSIASDYLFPYDGERFTITYTIIKKLKQYNQKVHNSKQLRASVIVYWLSQYNLRKVQYLAGHRYISSTERYVQDDLENLQEIVNNFHPIS